MKFGFSNIFFMSVILIYIVIAIINFSLFEKSMVGVYNLLLKIIPSFILIYFLMVLTDYFVNEKKIKNFLDKFDNWKGWVISAFGGIISSGPIFIWFPLLEKLKKRGIKNGLIVIFLYNRSIKLPHIPLLLIIYEPLFLIILFIMIFIGSIIQGIIIDKLIPFDKSVT